ncbi:MAG: amidohydrolase family protein [Trueperaceae bacterium]|nr:amidohydrolase family protein [Trueperaceae bacterium]
MLKRRILTADVVYSGLGTARDGGAVVVQDDGTERKVVLIDSLDVAQQNFPDDPVEHVGFAISPPLVNAHTHLDLTRMPYTPGTYEDFIRAVLRHSPQRQNEGLAAAEEGLQQLRNHQVNVVGDIVTSEAVMKRLLTDPTLQGVAYWEVLGPNPDDAEKIFNETVDTLRKFRAWERPGGVRLGLSPHTPHTVSGPLLQQLARLARGSRLPLQIHIAESAGEVALHRDGTGPLMELMRDFLPGWQPSGLSPVQYLAQLGVLEAEPTLVHMVYVDDDDVRTVQQANCAVVHCPRSNEALGSGRFVWELFAKHGVSVGIGTDSSGSSPSLAPQAEVASALRQHGTRSSPLALVRAAVKGGYRALGLKPPQVRRGDPASRLVVWQPLD